MQKEFIIRCRAVITHENKLLTVRHPGKSFLALPGGHMEFGEDPRKCVRREVTEELGIEPRVGALLFVNTFLDTDTRQPVEFFFEVLNGAEYLALDAMHRSHAHEIEECVWVDPTDNVRVMPEKFWAAFRDGTIDQARPIFISHL